MKLKTLFESGASQLEVAEEFSTLQWFQIHNELKKHYDNVTFPLVFLGKTETYDEYIASGARPPRQPLWQAEEDQLLMELVKTGATQLEIMQALPYRNWRRIRACIRKHYGNGVEIPNSGIDQTKSYAEVWVEQHKAECDDCSGIANHCFLSLL